VEKKNNSIIYITQDGHNYDNVKRFGIELIFLTEGLTNIFRTNDLINHLKLKLRNFKQSDYLLFSGNSVISSLCLSILFTKFKTVDILIFNSHDKKYCPRQIDLGNLTI